MGRVKNDWQDRNYVLRQFGQKEKETKKAYRNYVQKGVNEGRRPELVGGGLIREKVSIEELTSGSRRKEVSAIRGRIEIGLVEKYGIALAEVARRVGVSTSAISKIMQKANK